MKSRWLAIAALIAGLTSFVTAKEQVAPNGYKATTTYMPTTVYEPTTAYVQTTTTAPSSRVQTRTPYEIAASVDTHHLTPKTLYSSVASVPSQKLKPDNAYGTRTPPVSTFVAPSATQAGWIRQPTAVSGDVGNIAILPAVTSPLPGYAISTPYGGVAENGSYYGQPNVNVVPKTVAVSGYHRKDGTYVQGHYRSAPGSNPKSSRKK